MGSYGTKFIKSGSGDNVLTATDKDLAFTTKYKILKLFAWGNTTITTNGSGDGSVTITHGLGFAPSFFVFRKGTAQFTFLDASSYTNSFWPLGARCKWSDDNLDHALHVYSDSTNLIIEAKGATASKTYTFRYYILVDLAEDFSGSDLLDLSNQFGTKFSPTGVDVLTAKEYQLVYSTKYKALQYYDESFKTHSLTLPGIWASSVDQSPQEGTYVDINHGLGYPPFYLAFFKSDRFQTDTLIQVPFMGLNNIDVINYEVSGFCDSTRVRLSFYRLAQWSNGTNRQSFQNDE